MTTALTLPTGCVVIGAAVCLTLGAGLAILALSLCRAAAMRPLDDAYITTEDLNALDHREAQTSEDKDLDPDTLPAESLGGHNAGAVVKPFICKKCGGVNPKSEIGSAEIYRTLKLTCKCESELG